MSQQQDAAKLKGGGGHSHQRVDCFHTPGPRKLRSGPRKLRGEIETWFPPAKTLPSGQGLILFLAWRYIRVYFLGDVSRVKFLSGIVRSATGGFLAKKPAPRLAVLCLVQTKNVCFAARGCLKMGETPKWLMPLTSFKATPRAHTTSSGAAQQTGAREGGCPRACGQSRLRGSRSDGLGSRNSSP